MTTDDQRDTAAGEQVLTSVHEGAKTLGSLMALGGLVVTGLSIATGWLFDYAGWFIAALIVGAGLHWGAAVAKKID